MSGVREEWRPVVGHEGAYEVSDLGRVRSLDRICWSRVGRGLDPHRLVSRWMRGQLLRPGRASNGYLTVTVAGQSVPVQWLVAEAFIGPRPAGLLVLHGDGIRPRNVPDNLRYGTHADNAEDAARHGTRARGSAFRSAKLCEWTAAVVRALRGVWSQSDLAMLFGVSPAAIQAVHDGRTWKHAAATSRESALEWFWSYGPAGSLPEVSHAAH